MTLPLVRKMVEDIQFERVNDPQTLIHWHIYYEMRIWLRPFNSWLKRQVFRQMFADFAQGVADYAVAHPMPSTQTKAKVSKQAS